MSKTPLTGTDFGESAQFGTRLSYSEATYRDVVFGILYYLHLVALIGVAVYFWTTHSSSSSSSSSAGSLDGNLTGVFVTVGVCAVFAIFIGVVWLQIMKRFADIIIKAMLISTVVCFGLLAILGFAIGSLATAVVGIILALLNALYAWCIWRRIAFASALLSVSSSITSQYQGTMAVSLLVIVFDVLYLFILAAAIAGYQFAVNGDSSYGVWVLFVLGFFWAFQVNQNISHTTTCGVTATWYFSTELNYRPTLPALKRTMTTSFGSVCLGSLLVAIIQTLRVMIRSARNQRNACISALADCLLSCIERLIRFFNKYAYAHCATYGASFVQGARQSFELLTSRGFMAVINEDLTSLPITLGAMIGAILTGGVGFGVGWAFYHNDPSSDVRTFVPISLAIYGLFVGLIICATMLYVVHSSIVSLFVCYCEDPAALYQNRPEEYTRIATANQDFAVVYQRFGQGAAAGENQPPVVA